MLTPCHLPVFISKLSECKQVESSADFLADFANFKSFCSTWMVLAPLYDFTLSSLKLCCNPLFFPNKHVLILTNLHNINFFVLHSLIQPVKFSNSFSCTIVLGSIQRFIVFFSQSMHIQTVGELQGCQLKYFFVNAFIQIKHLVNFIFLSQFYIIILLQ